MHTHIRRPPLLSSVFDCACHRTNIFLLTKSSINRKIRLHICLPFKSKGSGARTGIPQPLPLGAKPISTNPPMGPGPDAGTPPPGTRKLNND